MPSMVFHAPYPMVYNPASASRLRPLRMRQAFADLGYEVIDLSGNLDQRRSRYRKLRARLASGERPSFLYSENSTQPNVLATSIKEGIAPLLESQIFRLARKHGVPAGVFYRDVFWKFDHLTASGPRAKIVRAAHRFDLWSYRSNRVHFFLPSLPIAKTLGLGAADRFSALPPGAEEQEIQSLPEGPLTCLYVGGLGGHYVLDEFFDAVRDTTIDLELCTPASNWRHSSVASKDSLNPNIRVHHLAHSGLRDLYARAHIGVLVVRPEEYWHFAAPVKLFEYFSYGKAVIATKGTHAATIVEQTGAGWVVDWDANAIRDLLTRLSADRDEVALRSRAAVRAARDNTWLSRARQVAETLTADGVKGSGTHD